MLYILLGKQPPFYGSSRAEIFSRIETGTFTTTGPYWNTVSDSAKHLVEQLMKYDYRERISAAEALRHPWLQQAKATASDQAIAERCVQRLQTIPKHKIFLRAMLCYVAIYEIDPDQEDRLRKAFIHLDANQDGVLDEEDLAQGLANVFPGLLEREKEAKRIIQRLDLNDKREIGYTDFLACTIRLNDESIKRAFEHFDCDGNAMISTQDLLQCFGKCYSEAKVDSLFDEFGLGHARTVSRLGAPGIGGSCRVCGYDGEV